MNNKKLKEALTPCWLSFAQYFVQLPHAEIMEVEYSAVPPTEKLTKIFMKLYDCPEEVTIQQFLEAFKRTVAN